MGFLLASLGLLNLFLTIAIFSKVNTHRHTRTSTHAAGYTQSCAHTQCACQEQCAYTCVRVCVYPNAVLR